MRFSQILQVLPLAGSAAAFSVRRDDTGEPVGAIDTTNQFIIEVDSVSTFLMILFNPGFSSFAHPRSAPGF